VWNEREYTAHPKWLLPPVELFLLSWGLAFYGLVFFSMGFAKLVLCLKPFRLIEKTGRNVWLSLILA
jgi:hypothetical protein